MGEGEGGAGALTPARVYRIELRRAAQRSLAAFPSGAQERIRRAIDVLATTPGPPSSPVRACPLKRPGGPGVRALCTAIVRSLRAAALRDCGRTTGEESASTEE